MPSTTVLAASLLPVLFFMSWYLSSTIAPPAIPDNLRDKRIILLIAHPDDESMFFSPTLQALTDPSLGNHLKILCMSTGNADGLGETRRKELEAAALTLGVRRREDIFVMDDPRFKDGMKEVWDPKEIARILAQAFAPQLIPPPTPKISSATTEKDKKDRKEKKPSSSSSSSSSKSKSSSFSLLKSSSKSSSSTRIKSPSPTSPSTPKITTPMAEPTGPRSTIDVLLTFDSHGISNHPNHIALHQASLLFLSQIMKNHLGHTCPIDLYTLNTINILRKYSFILDLLPTYTSTLISSLSRKFSSRPKPPGKNPRADRVVFVSGVKSYFKARSAMVEGHKSQMVWFRWGWIGLGRYMVVNDIRRVHVLGT